MGDSYTDPNYYSKDYSKGLTTSWPEIMRDQLPGKWKLINNAESGVGNNYILRDFFNYIGTHKKPDLVCIAWSNSARLSFTDHPSKKAVSKELCFDPVSHYLATNYVEKYKKKIMFNPAIVLGQWIHDTNSYKEYINKTLNDWVTNIFIIQSYCESHNIDYIFTQAIYPIAIGNEEDIEPRLESVTHNFASQPLALEINPDNFIGWPALGSIGGSTLNSKLLKHNDLMFGPLDDHPNEKGHAFIADIFLKRYSDV